MYVANFASDSIHVLDASTLAVLDIIPVGPKPTFVRVNEVTNHVFVVTYGNNSVVVLDGATDTILDIKSSGGFGAWGLAVNPILNRLYVSNRDTGSVTTLDGGKRLPGHQQPDRRPLWSDGIVTLRAGLQS